MRKSNRFRDPPPTAPISASGDTSLVFRLNLAFFLRQLGIFLVMDLLVITLATLGLTLYAENRCADVAGVVQSQGMPEPDTAPWMESGDYTVVPLDREPEGLEVPAFFSWLPIRDEVEGGRRSYDDMRYYVIEMPNGNEPYAVRVDMIGMFRTLQWVVMALLVCQVFSLIFNLFRNYRSIEKALRPIQDLTTTTTARLRAVGLRGMAVSRRAASRELENLTDELGKINATHLDSRIDAHSNQKELRTLALAINSMLDRVNLAYSAQMRFVSDASHELRTPIAVIQGYANLLNRWGKSDPEALDESITAIREEAQSMEHLVEQLLFLARGDNESQPVKKEHMDLIPLADEVWKEEVMIHPDRELEPRWERDTRAIVEADPGLMKQLLRILIDNSVKYSPEGSRIYLRVYTVERYARVTVQDEGMGIVPEALPHIFERFYRTDRSRDRKTGGTGLGLSIARWIVDRHDGWFEVVSRRDVGTRITFVLPLAEKEDVHEPENP